MLTRARFLLVTGLFVLATTAMAATAGTPGTALVAGATGETGRLMVAGLRKEGYAVRALVRDPAKARELLGDQAELVQGDVKDPATLGPAMQGVSVVLSAVGPGAATGPDRPEAIDYHGVKNLAEAAATAKVQQFVLVSSRGTTQEDNPLNKIFGDVLKWKLKGEDALRASGVPYTIVRPGGLVNEAGGQASISFEQGDVDRGQIKIARADVATICIQALKYPEARNRTFEVSATPGSPPADWRALFAALKPE